MHSAQVRVATLTMNDVGHQCAQSAVVPNRFTSPTIATISNESDYLLMGAELDLYAPLRRETRHEYACEPVSALHLYDVVV